MDFAAAREAFIAAREAHEDARRKSWIAGALAFQSKDHLLAARVAWQEMEAARAAAEEAYLRMRRALRGRRAA